MAYKDSETLQAGTPYSLEEYSFNCVFDDSPTLGTYARASMKKDGQTVYKTVSLPNASKISGWTVEANDDTADVYAVVMVPTGESSEHESSIDVRILPQAEGYPMPIPTGNSIVYKGKDHEIAPGWPERTQETTGMMWIAETPDSYYWGVASRTPGTITYITDEGEGYEPVITTENLTQHSTLLGTTYYQTPFNYSISKTGYEASGVMYQVPDNTYDRSVIETIIIDGVTIPVDPEYEEKEILVGRFAIELEDAGGVGPGSDWTDPGDYDPDWEEGDPTHTLFVTVTGALSGRHNDPIEDPSYSYIPADKDTVKDYGCGGDGGHGGGGGAGASTVVVHKFATNQANSKEVTAIARRHGYGSGGGKGGKGGDGCILVYY